VKTVLIVEDEVDLAEVLREALEMYGYRVVLAHDGREGLVKLASEQPELIITDIMMPLVDGYELIRNVRSNPQTRSIPIIAMSATDHVTHRPFLQKPFELDELVGLVDRTLDDPRKDQSEVS
jgi:CheY-like chemotaxis protein